MMLRSAEDENRDPKGTVLWHFFSPLKCYWGWRLNHETTEVNNLHSSGEIPILEDSGRFLSRFIQGETPARGADWNSHRVMFRFFRHISILQAVQIAASLQLWVFKGVCMGIWMCSCDPVSKSPSSILFSGPS